MKCGTLDGILEESKDISGNTGETQKMSIVTSIVPMLLVLTNVPWLCMLTLKEAGCRIYKNFLNYLCNVSVNLKLLQNKYISWRN